MAEWIISFAIQVAATVVGGQILCAIQKRKDRKKTSVKVTIKVTKRG